MPTSSARPDDLDAFAHASRAADDALLASAVKLRAAYDEFLAACRWGVLDAVSLISGLNPQFLAFNEQDAAWVAAIAAAFRRAGSHGGIASLPDAALDATLRRAGLGDVRGSVTFDDPVAYGFPPTTGYAVDPVNTASGNFVELETDLGFGGLLADMSLARTYNSRSDVVGAFGRGWSSWASTRLRARPEGAAYEGPDGQRALFPREGAGYGRVLGVAALVEVMPGGLAIEWFGGGRWEFDAAGAPVRVRRGPGMAFVLHHDEEGRLVALQHEGARRVELEWDGTRVAAATSSDGRRADYRYDDDRLVEVRRSDTTRRYGVDDAGRILSVIDADGVVEVANVYDDDGRVVEQRSPFGRATRFAYLPGCVTVTSDDDGGPANTYVHDGGRLLAVIDGDDRQTRMHYDAWGNPVVTTERGGAVTIQEWDERARVVRRVLPTGAELAFAYDEADRLVEVAASGGAVTTLRYEGDERNPAEVADPEGGVTRMRVEGGLLRELVDADGVGLRFEFDTHGNLLATIDADGNAVRLERDAAGRAVAAVTPLGRRTTFAYDDRGRLAERRDPVAGTWRYEHSAAGRLTAVTDPANGRREIRYGEHGARTATVDALGRVTSGSYDVFGNVTRVVAPDGSVSQLHYDALMRLAAIEDATGATWRREFDADGNPIAGVDPTGRRRAASLDVAGRIVALADDVVSIVFERDERGLVERVRRSDGTALQATYDRCGRRTQIVGARGEITRTQYTPAGRVRRRELPSGRVVGFEYDACGRLAARIDGAGRRTEQRYDADHALVELVDAAGEVTRLRYDDAGRLAELSEPGRGVTRCEYDAAGRPIALTDRVAGTRRFEYDAAGQRVAAIDANGAITRFAYDERGRLTATTDPLGATTTARYDTSGRLVERSDALGRLTTFARDSAGRLVERVDGDGRATRWSHDASGRVRGFGPAGREPIAIERDALGRATLIDEPGAPAIRLRSDEAGRVSERRRGELALRWRYGPDGERAALVYPDGSQTTYEYDAGGRLTGQEHPALGAIAYEHDAAGRLVAATGGGMCARWRYEHGDLVEYELAVDGGARRTASLTRDADGRVVAATIDGDEQRFGYDAAGQLLSAETASGPFAFAYDAAGRLVGTVSGAQTVEVEYDAAGQPLARRVDGSAEVVEYAYDGAGRRVRASTVAVAGAVDAQTEAGMGTDAVAGADGVTRTWRWDDLGRLAEIRSSDREHATRVVVDALGELAEVGGAPLLWDTAVRHSPPAWIDGRAVIGRGAPWALAGDGVAQLLAPDWQGTVGDVARDPWGAPLHATGVASGLRLGYRGEVEIDGETWLRNRLYEPFTRSFLQPDPLSPVAGGASAANPYGYAANNPLGLADPLGLRPVTDAELAAVRDAMNPGFGERLADAGTWALGALDKVVTWANPLTWAAYGLDQFDNPFTDALSFGVKALASPIATGIGLATGAYGALTGNLDGVDLENGELVFEWDRDADSFSGLTLGGTVNLFHGTPDDPLFEHETYHSYQATGWGNAFIPAYLAGGFWGLESSALAGDFQWDCFVGVSDDGSFGQPLELRPEQIGDSNNCH